MKRWCAYWPGNSDEQVKELTPLGRIGEPVDITDIVDLLVSDDARWITGQTLHAGGGLF